MMMEDDKENDYYAVDKHHGFSSSDDDDNEDSSNLHRKKKMSKRKGKEISSDHSNGSTEASNRCDDSDDELIRIQKKRSRNNRDDATYGVFNNEPGGKVEKMSAPRSIHFVPSAAGQNVELLPVVQTKDKQEIKTNVEDANAQFYALLARSRGNNSTKNKVTVPTTSETASATNDIQATPDIVAATRTVFGSLKRVVTKSANDIDFGKWEKHTKGIGAKLLAKMGYDGTGGLGSKKRRTFNITNDTTATSSATPSTGVSRSVEVVVRPSYLGLGYGNFQEASTLKVNKQIEAELHGTQYPLHNDPTTNQEEYIDVMMNNRRSNNFNNDWTTTSTIKSKNQKQQQQRDAYKKRKKQHGIEEEQVPTKIIDMRGSSSSSSLLSSSPKLGQELLYNVNLILSSMNANLHTCNDKIIFCKKKIQTIQGDIDLLNLNLLHSQEKQNRLEDIVSSIKDIQLQIHNNCIATRSNNNNNDTTTMYLQQLFTTFKHQFSQDYEILSLEQITIHLLSPWIEYELVQNWNNPLDSPHYVALLVEQWQTILKTNNSNNNNNAALSILILKHALPKLEKAFSGRWDVITQSKSVLTLYEACQTAFAVVSTINTTDDDYDIQQELGISTSVEISLCHILNDVIVPKLYHTVVSSWKPSLSLVTNNKRQDNEKEESSSQPIHEWLLPWLVHFNDDMKTTILKEIVRKFRNYFFKKNSSSTMNGALWYSSPFNDEAIRMLLPWKGIVDDDAMEHLIRDTIVPQLALLLSTKLVMNPSNQDLTPIQQVLSWYDAGLLPVFYLICLFEGLLFVPWTNTLFSWLSSESVNMEEVAQFYLGWKSLIPSRVLLSDETICRYLFCGLSMIDAALKKDLHALNELRPPPIGSKLAYYAQVVSRRIKQQQSYQQQQRLLQKEEAERLVKEKAKYSSEEIPQHILERSSFREVVQHYALGHDLIFQPKTSGTSIKDGKQVFNFGIVPVYFDSDVVFAWDSKKWKATSLEQLVNLNK